MTRSSAPQTRTPYRTSNRTLWCFALALAWVGLGGGSRAGGGPTVDVLKTLVFSKKIFISFTKDAVSAKSTKGNLLWKFDEFHSVNLEESKILEDFLIVKVNAGEPVRSYGVALDISTGREKFNFGEQFITRDNNYLYFTNSFPLDDFTELYPRPYGNINLLAYNLRTKTIKKYRYEVPRIPLDCFGDNNFISYFSFKKNLGENLLWDLDNKYCHIRINTSLNNLDINVSIRRK